MNASADIQTKTHNNVLAVPINAVTTRDKKGDNPNAAKGDGKDNNNNNDNNNDNNNNDVSPVSMEDLEEVVFVLQPDKTTVKKVKVKTDIQDINNIEITSGLKAGDMVVTGPYNLVSKTLKDGDKVKVVPKEQLFEESSGK